MSAEQYVNLCQRSLRMTYICLSGAIDNAERYQNNKNETEPLIMPPEWTPQGQSCISGGEMGYCKCNENRRQEEGNVARREEQDRQWKWSINADR